MVVIGNPPYSGESANKGKWIMDLMEDYKKEPGVKEKLKERNQKMINDDYVKFIRFAQYFINKNVTGKRKSDRANIKLSDRKKIQLKHID